ncbi:hypothetical protein [Actinoplanes xinjiangensis]|uniref:hypothetical protein n=1 Tax=Actinoplanes xinjiangensis TaxID=512350 RepID=UPI003438D832
MTAQQLADIEQRLTAIVEQPVAPAPKSVLDFRTAERCDTRCRDARGDGLSRSFQPQNQPQRWSTA